jgi:large subunit ribosomal protein L7/L12
MAIATEDFIKQIDEMTVLELNTLVKALEDHYGVSAAAATVAVAGGAAGGGEAAAEEKDEFDVVLESFGDKKIM